MKSHSSNFPDSLLQQFNFGATTIDAPAEENKDAPTVGKEAAAKKEGELERGQRNHPKWYPPNNGKSVSLKMMKMNQMRSL